MYVERVKAKAGKKVYQQILLRESYREPGAPRSRVKHRTLLNLTHFDPKDVAALETGLQFKNDLARLAALGSGEVKIVQDRAVGVVWVLWRLAQRVGLVKALGGSGEARLLLWQVFARLINQGSRLSAVRLADEHAACEILGLGGFDEDDLYASLDWLDRRQVQIEDALYSQRQGDKPAQLFLYDVTSSYLEGTENEYAAFGYNRDGKKGKRQIVVGLLTDGEGAPLSVEVFAGNTQDPQTVFSQVRKVAARFGAAAVTFVGDRGMLKSAQIAELQEESFHYLTAITKPQIESLIKDGVLQLGLFEDKLCEVSADGVRYILRRNPQRASEISASRADKFRSLCTLVRKKNAYLSEHPRARVEAALGQIKEYAHKLIIGDWVIVQVEGRTITVQKNEAALEQVSRLDGCYALKSDVPTAAADAHTLHARYKDLALVEQAFRTFKTGHLEIRPVYVRTAVHTRAHVFVVLLAYLLRRELDAAWRELDVTVEEGLSRLASLCAQEVLIPGHGGGCLTIPQPRPSVACLFQSLQIDPPTTLPRRQAIVATKRKLPSRRKSS